MGEQSGGLVCGVTMAAGGDCNRTRNTDANGGANRGTTWQRRG